MASAGSVLSGNAPARPQPAPAPSDPTPSVEDLTVDVEGKTAFALCRVVQNASEVFLYSNPNPDPGPNPSPPLQVSLRLSELFESRFGDLVTVGDAAAYGPLVEEFKALFGTVAANLQRVQTALKQQALPLLATMVRTVERAEGQRLTIELERQVLRQRLSRGEEEEQAALRVRLKATREAQQGCIDEIREALDELRAEAADLDDDDE